MAIISTIKEVPSIHTAFNPAVAEFGGTDECNLTITDERTQHSAVLTIDAVDGVATYELQNVVQSFFTDVVEPYPYKLSANCAYDYNLFARYSYGWSRRVGNKRRSFYGYACAVNSVAQFGDSTDLTDHCNEWLTGMARLRKWYGYPLTASFIPTTDTESKCEVYCDSRRVTYNGAAWNFANTDPKVVTMNVSASRLIKITPSGSKFYLRTNLGAMVRTAAAQPITLSNGTIDESGNVLPIVEGNAPKHAFYVRWINRFGGYDYLMMACKNYEALNLSATTTYSTYYSDPSTIGTNVHTLGKTALRKIKASSGQLPIDEVREARWLPFSPKIEFYDITTERWFGLQVSTFDFELAADQTTGQIDFTFELPLLTQF